MVQDESETAANREEKRVYTCIRCGNTITTSKDEMAVEGQFKHSFTNPHGYMFTIGCFFKAPGCISAGPSTDEFTWFPGYGWRISICTACGMHLGWEFSKGSASFFGLILNNLAEGDGK